MAISRAGNALRRACSSRLHTGGSSGASRKPEMLKRKRLLFALLGLLLLAASVHNAGRAWAKEQDLIFLSGPVSVHAARQTLAVAGVEMGIADGSLIVIDGESSSLQTLADFVQSHPNVAGSAEYLMINGTPILSEL